MPDGDDMGRILDFAARKQAEMPPSNGTNPMDFDETVVGRRFAASMHGKLAYDHSDRNWFVWTGAIWAPDGKADALERVKRFVEGERDRTLIKEDAKSLGKVKFVKAVESIAQSDPLLAVNGATWNADGWLLGTPEGVVDLRSGILRPGRPEDFISKQTLVAPAEPGTPAPLWDAFLREATQGDAEMQLFLQKWAGYCLTGDVSEEVLCFLYGPGGNGKGVFTGTLSAIMGAYAVTMPIEAFTAGSRQNPEYYRARMAGTRLVTASETEGGHQWAEAQIKELTGNETKVSARQPYGRPFEYWSQAKLQLVGNHAPSLKGRSPAMERRLRIVPFEHAPATPNLDLKGQLVAEYPAILRWVLDGCLDWQEGRLGTSAAIRDASSEYFEMQDVFGRWIEERCTLDGTLACGPGKLFTDYKGWTSTVGEVPLSSKEFYEQIKRTKGCKQKTIRGKQYVNGIGLKPEEGGRYADRDQ